MLLDVSSLWRPINNNNNYCFNLNITCATVYEYNLILNYTHLKQVKRQELRAFLCIKLFKLQVELISLNNPFDHCYNVDRKIEI